MSANLSTLKARRAGHRGQVTRLVNKLNVEIETLPDDELEAMRSELLRQKELILDFDSQIVELLEDGKDIEADIFSSSECVIILDTAVRRVAKVLDNTDNVKLTQSVKLPPIQLIKFSGDPLDWPKFWDLFRASIHERADLTGAGKFHYLVSQLTGEAEELLAGFDHTDGEYAEAIELLIETYGKKQRIIQARLNSLFNLKTPIANASDLSKFRSAYEGHLRGLKSLGADVEAAGFVFSELIISKLPTKIRDNLNRAHKSDMWTLSDLRKEIEVEIGHLHNLESNHSRDFDIFNSNPTTVFKASTSNNANNHSSPAAVRCSFCWGEHNSLNCMKYNTVESRKNRVVELRLCFNCIKGKHGVKHCTNVARCKNCKGKHHTTICTRNTVANKQVGTLKFKGDEDSLNAMSILSSANMSSSNTTGILPSARITILNNNQSLNVRTILDTGSQRTFLLDSIVKKLQLKVVGNIMLSINGFNMLGESKMYEIVEFCISTCNGLFNMNAIAIDKLPSNIVMNGRSNIVHKLNSQGYILADPIDSDVLNDVEMLIGVDYFFKLVGAKQFEEGVYTMPSIVGTIMGGTLTNNISCNVTTVLRIDIDHSCTLDDKLRRMWEIDSVEDSDTVNNEVIKNFTNSIKYVDGHYSVALPWKNNVDLPSNYYYAKSRLHSNLNNLRKNPDDLKCYDSIINEQLSLGFIEEVTNVKPTSNTVHYLAHRGIKRDSETTPLRIVFDCSAKPNKNKPSLNECLYSGPNLINDLTKILLRFRLDEYAATSDIKKAFLNVGLQEQDRNCTRFLWPDNPYDESSVLKTYRFRSVLFGSTASPFLLNATIKHHLKSKTDNCARDIEDNIYVDNLYITANSESELNDKKKFCICSLGEAGFNLHEWFSNSNIVTDVKSDNKTKHICKVLGVNWNMSEDSLSVATNELEHNQLCKRSIVSSVASIFDPLGMLLPITVRGKIIIQKLWKLKTAWDEEVNSEINNLFTCFIEDFRNVVNVNVKRCITDCREGILHIFSDASTQSYGSVAYFCSQDDCKFVIAKCKIAPINARTLPELELCAINYSVKLANFIKDCYKSVNIQNCFIWSDSSIALQWLNSNKLKKQFVKNKVNEIRRLSDNLKFQYVNGSDNPADLLTRGISARSFKAKLDIWFDGPNWLHTGSWPDTPFSLKSDLVCVAGDCSDQPILEHSRDNNYKPMLLVNFEKYSKLSKFLRILAYVYRFFNNSRKVKCNNSYKLTVGEINSMELKIIKETQIHYFPEIFSYFESKTKSKCPPLVSHLRIFLSDGILRCGGRIQHSNVDSNVKYPILIPPKSWFSVLLIREIHEEFHFGVNSVISKLREKYWLPKCRQNVKSIIKRCIVCKKLQCRPYLPPDVPPLPEIRVSDDVPFSVTCVDYTGSLNVKCYDSVIKVYICLFTCAITRAVHLEIAEDLSSETFIRCLRRLSGRRSYPKYLISDNATNFKGGEVMINEIIKSNVCNNYFLEHKIIWKFNTPKAPWMGGVFERLIGVCKLTLKKVLGQACVTFYELSTIIVQIEAAINDRPLTYSSDDLFELIPLTPSMLLTGRRILQLPEYVNIDELYDPSFNVKEIITKRMIYCNSVMKDLLNRWKKEYLVSLRERDRNLSKSVQSIVKVGQVVLIHDDCPRQFWKMGYIVGLNVGGDGVVRSVNLKTSSGNLTRPIIKLYPLELDVEINETLKENVTSRPLRDAARKALVRLRELS